MSVKMNWKMCMKVCEVGDNGEMCEVEPQWGENGWKKCGKNEREIGKMKFVYEFFINSSVVVSGVNIKTTNT